MKQNKRTFGVKVINKNNKGKIINSTIKVRKG